MIAIIDYSVGNIRSIENMLARIGIESVVTSDPEIIIKSEKIILPGVGSFDYGINALQKLDLIDVLNDLVLIQKKPLLGICLGAQLLGHGSEEGNEKGLGWLDLTCKRFIPQGNLPVPHMGWRDTVPFFSTELFKEEDSYAYEFYFVHSYYIECSNKEDILASSVYGHEFVCAVARDNIYGVQFHPEKSLKQGMQLLENFGRL